MAEVRTRLESTFPQVHPTVVEAALRLAAHEPDDGRSHEQGDGLEARARRRLRFADR
jgi:hypothetical protein